MLSGSIRDNYHTINDWLGLDKKYIIFHLLAELGSKYRNDSATTEYLASQYSEHLIGQ